VTIAKDAQKRLHANGDAACAQRGGTFSAASGKNEY
jgi:hypothetical protein